MKRMQRVFGDLDALLFVDNKLDEERKAAYLAHLADHPADAERALRWGRQNDTIRATFAGVAVEPVPLWLRLGQVAAEPSPAAARDTDQRTGPRGRAEARLIDLRSAPRPIDPASAAPAPAAAMPPARHRSTSIILSAALLLGLGLLILTATRTLLPQPLPAESGRAVSDNPGLSRAVDAYRTYATDPVRPVEIAAAEQPLLDHWLQRRLALPVRMPDLKGEGWTALGGRLVPGDDGPAGFYLYESDAGERLGVFVARSKAAPANTLALDPMAGGGSALSWVSGSLAYVVTVDRSLDWLSRNAEVLRNRVTRGG